MLWYYHFPLFTGMEAQRLYNRHITSSWPGRFPGIAGNAGNRGNDGKLHKSKPNTKPH